MSDSPARSFIIPYLHQQYHISPLPLIPSLPHIHLIPMTPSSLVAHGRCSSLFQGTEQHGLQCNLCPVGNKAVPRSDVCWVSEGAGSWLLHLNETPSTAVWIIVLIFWVHFFLVVCFTLLFHKWVKVGKPANKSSLIPYPLPFEFPFVFRLRTRTQTSVMRCIHWAHTQGHGRNNELLVTVQTGEINRAPLIL